MSVDINKKINRVGTPSVKWEFIDVGKPEDLEEMLRLSIADMDFAVTKEIRDVLKERIERNFLVILYHIQKHTINQCEYWFIY